MRVFIFGSKIEYYASFVLCWEYTVSINVFNLKPATLILIFLSFYFGINLIGL